MPEPITMGTYLAVAGTLKLIEAGVNWWNSSRQRDADDTHRDNVRNIFKQLTKHLPDFDLTISDPPELIMEKLQLPKYRAHLAKTKLNPETIKRVGTFEPQLLRMIEEQAPKMLQDTSKSLEYQKNQEKALNEFERISEQGGMDESLRALVERSKRRTKQEHTARSRAMDEQMQRRGMADSGASLLSQLSGQEAAMQQDAQTELDASGLASRNRLQAILSGGQLAGGLRDAEMSREKFNVNSINDFNRRMSSREMNIQEANTQMQNQADLLNLQERQRLSEMNRYRDDEMAIRERQESVQDQLREDSILDKNYARDFTERGYSNSLRMQQELLARREKQRIEDLKQRSFNNRQNLARGQAGLSEMARDTSQNRSQQRANLVGGLADAGIMGMDVYQGHAREGERQKRWDDLMARQNKPMGWGSQAGKGYNLGLNYTPQFSNPDEYEEYMRRQRGR
tara:strand:+ start:26722 stop:28086 length:1365 start_codon:yes stop_codon:yes gene_type:complete